MPYFNKVFVPAPNTVQLELVYQTWGGFAENVYHVQGDGPITDIEGLCQRMITLFASWDHDNLRGLRSTDYALNKVTARDIGMIDGAAYEQPFGQSGTVASPALPDNVTLAVKWNTARTGRSYRGRTYHIGLAQSMVSQDQVTLSNQTAIILAYNALKDAVAAETWTTFGPTTGKLAVVSASHNKVARTTAAITPITTASLVDGFTDSQRRRLKGRGT